MKVRINYIVDVSNNFRKAMRLRFGDSGLATREEIKQHFRLHGMTLDDELMYEYVDELEALEKKA